MSATTLPPLVSRQEQAALLSAALERIAKTQGERAPVAVFDLDGTLVDNRPRTSAILHELAEKWSSTHPREADILRTIRYGELDYLLEGNLRGAGIGEDGLIAEAIDYWRSRFFFDECMRHDVALDGALSFVRACHDAGAIVVYFTGRDLPNMALGTLASLRDLGFPIGVPGTELVLKPNAEISDADFKRDFTPKLGRRGVLTAAFDNEPGNCNIFKELFPALDVFLVHTQHHPDAPPLAADIPVIADFDMGA
ncbi:MAG: HAD family hydrolase [Polyangiaceae bacterium]